MAEKKKSKRKKKNVSEDAKDEAKVKRSRKGSKKSGAKKAKSAEKADKKTRKRRDEQTAKKSRKVKSPKRRSKTKSKATSARATVVAVEAGVKALEEYKRKPYTFARRLTKLVQKITGDKEVFCHYVPGMDAQNKRTRQSEVYRSWFMMFKAPGGRATQPVLMHFSDHLVEVRGQRLVNFILNNFVYDQYRTSLVAADPVLKGGEE